MANIIRLDQIQSNAGNVALNLNSNTNGVEFTGGFIPASLVIPNWAGENARPTSGISPGYLGYNSTDVQLEVYYGIDPDDGSQIWGTTAGRVTVVVVLKMIWNLLILLLMERVTTMFLELRLSLNH